MADRVLGKSWGLGTELFYAAVRGLRMVAGLCVDGGRE